MNFENLNTIFSLFLIAILFPIALLPIVSEAIKAVTIRDTIKELNLKLSIIFLAIITPALPDNIPHISPTTSLQKLETLSAFLISLTAVLAPLTFLELFA